MHKICTEALTILVSPLLVVTVSHALCGSGNLRAQSTRLAEAPAESLGKNYQFPYGKETTFP